MSEVPLAQAARVIVSYGPPRRMLAFTSPGLMRAHEPPSPHTHQGRNTTDYGKPRRARRQHLLPFPLLLLIVVPYLVGAALGSPLRRESSRAYLPVEFRDFMAPNHSNTLKYQTKPYLGRALSPAFGVLVRHLSASRDRPGLFSSTPFGAITPPQCPASIPRVTLHAGKSSALAALPSSLGRIHRPAAQRSPGDICAGGSDGTWASPIGGRGLSSRPSTWPAVDKWAALTCIPWWRLCDGLRHLVKHPEEVTKTSTRAATDFASSTALGQKVRGLKELCADRVGSAGLWLRICTGVPLALAAIGAVLLSPLPAFATLGWIQSLVGLGEFLALCEKKKFAVASLAGNAAANALVMGAAATGHSETHLLAEAAAICGHLLASLLSPPSRRGISDVGASVFGHVWCAFLPSFWVRLRALRCPSLKSEESQQQPQQPQQQLGATASAAEGSHHCQKPAVIGADEALGRPHSFLLRLSSRCLTAIHEGGQAFRAALRAPWGPRWLVLYGFLLIALNDSVAYFMGSYFGRTGIASLFPIFRGTPLPPAALVSPKKTVLGLATGAATSAAVGAFLAAALGATAAKQASKRVHFRSPLHKEYPIHAASRASPSEFTRACISAFQTREGDGAVKKKLLCLLCLGSVGAFMGLSVSAIATAGDLLASLLKRDAGVKDSGALLPGHGGWLDRTDAHLLAGPLLFVFGRVLQRFLFELEAAAAEQQEQLLPSGTAFRVGFPSTRPPTKEGMRRQKNRQLDSTEGSS